MTAISDPAEENEMATATKNSPGVRLQSWVPPDLAAKVKARADDERRSVSALLRIAVEDQLRGESR